METSFVVFDSGTDTIDPKEELFMSNKQRQRRTKVKKNSRTSSERMRQKLATKAALAQAHEERCADNKDQEDEHAKHWTETFSRMDAELQKALSSKEWIIEVNSMTVPDEVAQKMVRLLPGILFCWPMQGLRMMALELDGEVWIYRASGSEEIADSDRWCMLSTIFDGQRDERHAADCNC